MHRPAGQSFLEFRDCFEPSFTVGLFQPKGWQPCGDDEEEEEVSTSFLRSPLTPEASLLHFEKAASNHNLRKGARKEPMGRERGGIVASFEHRSRPPAQMCPGKWAARKNGHEATSQGKSDLSSGDARWMEEEERGEVMAI